MNADGGIHVADQRAHQPLGFSEHSPPEAWETLKLLHIETKDDGQMMFNVSGDCSSFSENLDEFDSIRSVLLYRSVKSRYAVICPFMFVFVFMFVLQTQHVGGWIVSERQSGFKNPQGGRNNDETQQRRVL